MADHAKARCSSVPVLPSVLTAGQSVIFFIPAKDDFGEFAPAHLPVRAQHSARRHTFAGNNAFPRIVNSQMLAETRSIGQVAVAATCSAVTCGAAFRVRNSLIEPAALFVQLPSQRRWAGNRSRRVRSVCDGKRR